MNRYEMEYEMSLYGDEEENEEETTDGIGHVGEKFTPYEPAYYSDTVDYWDD